MIRIDEIYCNTFLPRVQAQPFHDMHWFDPFGSVRFSDIVSLPKVPWDDRAVRFVFWDQEPLHPETTTATLGAFTKMYNGQHHLITSERDSEAVRDVCATYGFQSHYYFFHGWAALDWFRGYDRTFLMKPPEQRTITHTILMPNRIVAGRRLHRLILLYNFIKKNLNIKNCLISFPAICPGENLSVEAAVQPLQTIYPDISEVFFLKSNKTYKTYNNSFTGLPLRFENENDHPMQSCWLDLFNEGASSLLYLVTETLAQGRRQHLTEKTFKPICMRMPFVLAGTQGSLRYLRSYGFRTFGHVWDESYDDEPNDVLRMERIASLIVSLDELPNSAKQELFFECMATVEHNYRHFYDGTFERILWRELTHMMENMGV